MITLNVLVPVLARYCKKVNKECQPLHGNLNLWFKAKKIPTLQRDKKGKLEKTEANHLIVEFV